MARTFGQIDCSAWRGDQDWRALSMDGQWLYMMLVSQPDISMAGHLPIADRRWRQMNSNDDAGRLELALVELVERGYVVIDEATDEVLVRSFARTRTQWENPRRVRALVSAVAQIHSAVLHAALAKDLARIGRALDGSSITPAEGPSERTAEHPGETPEIPAQMSDISAERSTTRFRAPAQGEGRREKGEFLTGGDATRALERDPSLVNTLVGEFVEGCSKRPPDQIVARIGREVKGLLEQGQHEADVRAGLKIVGSKCLQPSALAGAVHEASQKRGARYDDSVWDNRDTGSDISLLSPPDPVRASLAGVAV